MKIILHIKHKKFYIFTCKCKKFVLTLHQIQHDMKSEINIPIDKFVDLYVTLSLLAIIQNTIADDPINTKIKMMEEMFEDQVGKPISHMIEEEN